MRYLGVDYGQRRIGLALSDPGGRLAFPYATLEKAGRDALFAALLGILEKEKVEAVVVGLPLALDGSDTLSTRQARNFAASLGRRTALPILLEDERLSTVAASEDLRSAQVRGKKVRAAVDQQAAVRILQGCLDRQARAPVS